MTLPKEKLREAQYLRDNREELIEELATTIVHKVSSTQWHPHTETVQTVLLCYFGSVISISGMIFMHREKRVCLDI